MIHVKQTYNFKRLIPNKKSILYLYEIYAIPENIRIQYLSKLSKRKDAANQKNVRLLKIIYRIVNNENFHSWKPAQICNKLEFSMKQLYWHKSKILKDLREMTFRWKDTERELMLNKLKIQSNNDEILIIKSRKMNEIGMVKEAKAIFLKLSHKLENKIFNSSFIIDDLLLLAEIYENLFTYYYAQRNRAKFLVFYKKLRYLSSRVSEKISGSILEPERKNSILIQIRIRSLRGDYYLNSFQAFSSLHSLNEIENLKEISKLSFKIRDYRRRAASFYDLASTLSLDFPYRPEREKKINEYLHKGLRICRERNFRIHECAFRADLKVRDIDPKCSIEERLSSLKQVYEEAKEINPVSIWTIRCLNSYISLLVHTKSIEYNIMLDELTKLRILRSQTANAIFNIYMNKSAVAESGLYNASVKKINKSSLVVLTAIDKQSLKDIELSTLNTINELRNMHFINARIYLLINLTLYQFLRGKNFDFDKTSSLLRKIEWLKKTKGIRNPVTENYFELLKTGLLMFGESLKYNSKKDILGKYLKDFSDTSGTIIRGNYQSLSLAKIYLYITFVANELDYPEIWDIVEKQWKYLEQNHPAVIESLRNRLEESKAKAA